MNNYVKEREVAASTLSRDQGVNMIHFPKAYTYEFKQTVNNTVFCFLSVFYIALERIIPLVKGCCYLNMKLSL